MKLSEERQGTCTPELFPSCELMTEDIAKRIFQKVDHKALLAIVPKVNKGWHNFFHSPLFLAERLKAELSAVKGNKIPVDRWVGRYSIDKEYSYNTEDMALLQCALLQDKGIGYRESSHCVLLGPDSEGGFRASDDQEIYFVCVLNPIDGGAEGLKTIDKTVLADFIRLLDVGKISRARMLFPYCRDKNHWLLSEAVIIKTADKYTVRLWMHDTCGKGKLTPEESKLLLSLFHKIPNVKIDTKESVYEGRQTQEDAYSRSAIVSSDLLKRIDGRSLDQAVLEMGVERLRRSQLVTCIEVLDESKREELIRLFCAMTGDGKRNTSPPKPDSYLPPLIDRQSFLDRSSRGSDMLNSSEELVAVALGLKGSVWENRRADATVKGAIRLFKKDKVKDEEMIMEILPFAKHSNYQHLVIEALIPAIRGSITTRGKVNLLCGLIEAYRLACQSPNSQATLLKQYDNIFQVCGELNYLNMRNEDSSGLVRVMRGICGLTDAMVDANIVDSKKINQHQPAYRTLANLIGHKDPEINYLATYAQQGFLRMPRDNKKPHLIYRQLLDEQSKKTRIGLSALGGVVRAITGAATSSDTNVQRVVPSDVLGTIKSDSWYDQLRVLDVFIDRAFLGERKDITEDDPTKLLSLNAGINFLRGLSLRLETIARRLPKLLEQPYFTTCPEMVFEGVINLPDEQVCPLTCGKMAILLKEISRTQAKPERLLTKEERVYATWKRALGQKKQDKKTLKTGIKNAIVLLLITNNNSHQHELMDYLQLVLLAKKPYKIAIGDEFQLKIFQTLRLLFLYGSDEMKADIRQCISQLSKEGGKKLSEKFKEYGLDNPDQLEAQKHWRFDEKRNTLIRRADVSIQDTDRDIGNEPDYMKLFEEQRDAIYGDERNDPDSIDLLERELYITGQGSIYNWYQEEKSAKMKEKKKKGLEGNVEAFLDDEDENKVMLMTGDSGSGKSMFCERFSLEEMELYERTLQDGSYEKNPRYIPIFISLPCMAVSVGCEGDAVIRYLQQIKKWSDKQIDFLKNNRRVLFILDGYDEMYPLRDRMYVNIFTENHFKGWRDVKVIITCRVQWLMSLDEDSRDDLFRPHMKKKVEDDHFAHVKVLSFSGRQVEKYVEQFLVVMKDVILKDFHKHDEALSKLAKYRDMSAHEKETLWLDKAIHLKYIEEVPGLNDLVSTPLLLRYAMELMFDLVLTFEKHKNERRTMRVLETELYGGFVKRYIDRQFKKLVENKQLYTLGQTNIRVEMKAFSRELAKAIRIHLISKGLPAVVTYQPPESRYDEETSDDNIWKRFFGIEDKVRNLERTGCPLRRVGPHQYAFMHETLQYYFIAEANTQDVPSYTLAERAEILIDVPGGGDKKEPEEDEDGALLNSMFV